MRWVRRLWRPMTATTPALLPAPVLYRAGHPYAGHRRCVARYHQPQIHRRLPATATNRANQTWRTRTSEDRPASGGGVPIARMTTYPAHRMRRHRLSFQLLSSLVFWVCRNNVLSHGITSLRRHKRLKISISATSVVVFCPLLTYIRVCLQAASFA